MTNGDQVVATRAECWMCSYCPVLASGKRGPTQEGMLTVQIGTTDLICCHLLSAPFLIRFLSFSHVFV